ncbi:MAG: hypothetical protein U1E65_17155 [Myxococcota bacterium]
MAVRPPGLDPFSPAYDQWLAEVGKEIDQVGKWLAQNFPEIKTGAASPFKDNYVRSGAEPGTNMLTDPGAIAAMLGNMGTGANVPGFVGFGKHMKGAPLGEANSEADPTREALDLMAKGFVTNDIMDYFRDVGRVDDQRVWDRQFQTKEAYFDSEATYSADVLRQDQLRRDMESLDLQRRDADNYNSRRTQEDLERQQRDQADYQRRRAMDDADRQRRDDEAYRRQRDLDDYYNRNR